MEDHICLQSLSTQWLFKNYTLNSKYKLVTYSSNAEVKYLVSLGMQCVYVYFCFCHCLLLLILLWHNYLLWTFSVWNKTWLTDWLISWFFRSEYLTQLLTVYTSLLQQFNSVRHSGVLHDVSNAGNQLQVGDNKYSHAWLRNVLQYQQYTASRINKTSYLTIYKI